MSGCVSPLSFAEDKAEVRNGHVFLRAAEEIEAALERNGYVDAGQVDAKIDHGVATLMGVVSDVSGFRAARDAGRYTHGVVDIDNRLTVG